MPKHRNPTQCFFITFPKSGTVTKQDFRDALRPLYIKYIAVAKESHEDGTPHLHAHVVFGKQHLARTPGISWDKLMKHLTMQYPADYKRINIQTTRNVKPDSYIFKEDIDPLIEGEIPKKRKTLLQEKDMEERMAARWPSQYVGSALTDTYKLTDYLDEINLVELHLSAMKNTSVQTYKYYDPWMLGPLPRGIS